MPQYEPQHADVVYIGTISGNLQPVLITKPSEAMAWLEADKDQGHSRRLYEVGLNGPTRVVVERPAPRLVAATEIAVTR